MRVYLPSLHTIMVCQSWVMFVSMEHLPRFCNYLDAYSLSIVVRR